MAEFASSAPIVPAGPRPDSSRGERRLWGSLILPVGRMCGRRRLASRLHVGETEAAGRAGPGLQPFRLPGFLHSPNVYFLSTNRAGASGCQTCCCALKADRPEPGGRASRRDPPGGSEAATCAGCPCPCSVSLFAGGNGGSERGGAASGTEAAAAPGALVLEPLTPPPTPGQVASGANTLCAPSGQLRT